MKKTTLALAFFLVLPVGLGLTGCKRDAYIDEGKVEVEDDGGVVPGTAAASEVRFGPPGVTPVEAQDQDGGLERDGGIPLLGPDGGTARSENDTVRNTTVPDAGATPEEACLDRWLEGKGLDAYGNKEGTMYAGGTPLFDERTGKTTPRTEYVYAKHPEAKAACSPGK